MDDATFPHTAPHRRPAPPWLVYVLVGAVVAVTVVGNIGGGMAPKLLKEHPLLLMALNPRYRWYVVAAPRIDPATFFGVGLARLLLSDPVYFALGWFYGDKAISYMSDAFGDPFISTARRWFLRAGTLMALFAAGPIICLLAGAAGMRPRRFFTLDILGTAVIVLALRLFSDALRPVIDSLLRFNDRNYRTLTILFVASAVLTLARFGLKRMRAARDFAIDAADDD